MMGAAASIYSNAQSLHSTKHKAPILWLDNISRAALIIILLFLAAYVGAGYIVPH